MKLFFFIRSATVNLNSYQIKDIPGSTGRLDVISRCILSALLNGDKFMEDTQIWIFFDNYGTFVFDSESLNIKTFPRSEILLSDYIVNLIRNKSDNIYDQNNPLDLVKYSMINILDAIKQKIKEGLNIYVLNEDGDDFFKYRDEILSMKKAVFIIGSQSGEFINSKKLRELNLPYISLGNQAYLASSVIRLIRLNLKLEI